MDKSLRDAFYTYQVNEALVKCIEFRLQTLLRLDDPFHWVANEVRLKQVLYPDLSYSTLEDIVLQELILRFSDKILDRRWHLHNVLYFEHDTRVFVEVNQITSADELEMKLQFQINLAVIEFGNKEVA